MNDDDKIISIETTLYEHEQQITELSDVIGAQWKEIDRLKRLLDQALEKIEDMEDSLPTPEAKKPPHY